MEIISKAAETVLQSRVDVRKPLFKHIQDYLSKIKQGAVELGTLSIIEFMSQLLPKDYYSLKQKLALKQQGGKGSSARVQLLFFLIDRTSGNRVEAECWTLEVRRKREVVGSGVRLVAEFFKEVIFILNKLPLFSIYQKERQLKTKYMQDYKILFENLRTHTLIDLRAKDCIRREDDYLALSAEIDYLPSFRALITRPSPIEDSKRKVSIATSEYDGERKVSVYAFYDPDLDFTFLSSDDEDFNKKGNSQSIEIRMDLQQEVS